MHQISHSLTLMKQIKIQEKTNQTTSKVKIPFQIQYLIKVIIKTTNLPKVTISINK